MSYCSLLHKASRGRPGEESGRRAAGHAGNVRCQDRPMVPSATQLLGWGVMKRLPLLVCLLCLLTAVASACRSAAPGSTATPQMPKPTAPSPAAVQAGAESAQSSFKTLGGRVIGMAESGEFDSYDKPGAPGAEAFGDNFTGSDRKAAKLSIVAGSAEHFDSIQELIESLETDDDMLGRQPPVSRAPTSRRVSEERRNVSVLGLLAAASREDDNDFHLIICDDPTASAGDQFCFNVEVSGLPASGPHKSRLRMARTQFSSLLNNNLPGNSYRFYSPAIPVRVTGSLFYDVSHKPGAVGPKKFRPETAWEIHPVTEIVEREE